MYPAGGRKEGIHVGTVCEIGLGGAYQTNRSIKPSTRGSQAATLKNHILPILGSLDISEISPKHISQFFRGLAEKRLSPKSVLNIYQLLHVMFEVAAEHDMVDSNPVRRKLHRPPHKHKKMPIWSAVNVQKILQGGAGSMEGSVLVHRVDGRSGWRIVGIAVEGHRLGCEDDHVRKRFLERPVVGLDQDWPRACPVYAEEFRANSGKAS
jgi:hypothetical protein